jgi:hypothetical protein
VPEDLQAPRITHSNPLPFSVVVEGKGSRGDFDKLHQTWTSSHFKIPKSAQVDFINFMRANKVLMKVISILTLPCLLEG